MALTGALRHVDPAVVEAQVRVNLTGSWRSIHAFLPMVVERRGYILGVASVVRRSSRRRASAPTRRARPGFEALLRTLRQEVAHLGVDVGIAYFHWIDTDMVRGAEREIPEFAELRAEMRGPAGRTLPVAAAGRGHRARRRRPRAARAGAPLGRRRWTGCAASSRPWPTSRGERVGERVDRMTAEAVRERGPVGGRVRPRDHRAEPGRGASASRH